MSRIVISGSCWWDRIFGRCRAWCPSTSSRTSMPWGEWGFDSECRHRIRPDPRMSMRQHAADGTGGQKLVRHPAKDPLTQSAVPVSTGHDQVGFLGANKLEKLGRNRASGALPGFVGHNDTVAHEVACDVGKGFLV